MDLRGARPGDRHMRGILKFANRGCSYLLGTGGKLGLVKTGPSNRQAESERIWGRLRKRQRLTKRSGRLVASYRLIEALR